MVKVSPFADVVLSPQLVFKIIYAYWSAWVQSPPPCRDAQPNLFPGRKTSTLFVRQVTELFLNVPNSKVI